jgi:hypothetical protein
MSDKERKQFNDGWTVGQKGYTPTKNPDSFGYKPASGSLGNPPTSGSAVSKPTPEKKG